MTHPNQCFSVQIDTATARMIPDGCVYAEGVLLSYASRPEINVEHTNDAGFWRYALLGGIQTHQVVRKSGIDEPPTSFELPKRDSMPLHNWVNDDADGLQDIAAYLEAPRRYDAGLFVSFHGVHVEWLTTYLAELETSGLPRASLGSLLGIAVEAVAFARPVTTQTAVDIDTRRAAA